MEWMEDGESRVGYWRKVGGLKVEEDKGGN